MLEMIQSGVHIYGLVVLAVIGILSKLMTAIRYGRLERQASEAAITRDSYIRFWKNKFENAFRINKGVNDIGLFVDRCLEQYKFCGMRMMVWERINGLLCAACILLGVAALTVEQGGGADVSRMLNHFLAVVCICGVMLFAEFFCETARKRERIGAKLEEYFGNVLSKKLLLGAEMITTEPEVLQGEPREPIADRRENKAVIDREEFDRERLKLSLEKIAASREPEPEGRRERKNRVRREEDARLIEEILREYLR